jgi:urease accessory protein
VPERPAELLAALQHADTVFPSGAVSFSWGLEALYNRGIVTDSDMLSAFAAAHIKGRWANLDRVMMVHAHRARGDLQRICELDALTEAQSLSAEQRLGSSRMGDAFLRTHQKLGTPLAKDYAGLIRQGQAYGHIAVVQGLIWGQLGFEPLQIQAMAAHGICTGLMSAGVRLSIIGHVDAQAIHAGLLPVIASIIEQPVCCAEEAYSFIPQIEIASMNHETDEMRLFVN